MLLNTFPFFVFFIIVYIAYWKIPKNIRWVFLLLASYYFFGSWKPAYLGLIFLTTIINYFLALSIHTSVQYKKGFLILALLFDLGALLIFKYFNFFAYSVAQVFLLGHWTVHLPQFTLLVPIGISFYTFQTIGYLTDVYRGKIKPEKHFGYLALFLCFFPQVSAGPIERADELLPQFKKIHEFNYLQAASGLKLFTFGLFKKMVIADNLAIIVDRVFNSLPTYKGLSLVIAVVLFSWQIYTDFSGYTDMSRGVARMLGFDLVPNFNLPYFATSVRDFWRRWHMSLSRWFRDYIYLPLGGNRGSLVKTCVNVLIVFTLCGLWHGAAWTFVLWGVFHGFVMAGERVVEKLSENRLYVPNYLKVAYTYFMVSISWIFFRANTLPDALYVFRYSMVGLKNIISPNYIWASLNQLFVRNKTEMIITFGLLCIALLIDQISRTTPLSQRIRKQPVIVRYALYVLMLLMIVHLRNADIKAFIYTRF